MCDGRIDESISNVNPSQWDAVFIILCDSPLSFPMVTKLKYFPVILGMPLNSVPFFLFSLSPISRFGQILITCRQINYHNCFKRLLYSISTYLSITLTF